MLQGFIGLLKKILMIGAQPATEVLRMYNPALSVLLQVLLNSTVVAEALNTSPGSGPTKKEMSDASVDIASPVIEKVFLEAGKPVRNRLLFSIGVSKIKEGVVDILNSTGDNTKPE